MADTRTTSDTASYEGTAASAATDGDSDSAILKGLLEVAKNQQETLEVLAESMKNLEEGIGTKLAESLRGIEKGLGTLERFTTSGTHSVIEIANGSHNSFLSHRPYGAATSCKGYLIRASVEGDLRNGHGGDDWSSEDMGRWHGRNVNLCAPAPNHDHDILSESLPQVALFVTIVTAFLGPTLLKLSQDPADVTNDLLRNLTMIVYETSVLNGLRVPENVPQPMPFKPDRSDEILTLLWFASLLLSVCGKSYPRFRTLTSH